MISGDKSKNMSRDTNNAIKLFLPFPVFPYILGSFFDPITSVLSVPSVVKDKK
jgi:hypothetical protein